MIRFKADGRHSVVIRKVRYRYDIVQDVEVSFQKKPQFLDLRPTTDERTDWEGPTFPGLNVPGDEAGTVIEKIKVDDDFREFCDHGSHWASVGCGICMHERKQQIKKELERRAQMNLVSQYVDELQRLKARIAQRAKDDPDFADEDVLEYEKLRISELATLINNRGKKPLNPKPRIHNGHQH